MKTRLFTSIGIVIVLAIAFILKYFVSSYFFFFFFLLIACVASFEASKLFSKMGKFNSKIISTIFPCFLMLVLLLCLAYNASIGIVYTIVIMVATILLFFIFTFLISLANFKNTTVEIKAWKLDKSYNLAKYSFFKALNTTLVFIYPAFLLLFMTIINHFEDLSNTFTVLTESNGIVSIFVLLMAFLIPIFTDTFAYLTGGLIGGKKLAPKISPNKTISGAVGGLLWCVLLSVVVMCIFNSIPACAGILAEAGINIWRIVIISFIGSILCQLGDLCESYLKRSAGVKDSGAIFPGHGGMLDRFDSYIFLMPYLFVAFSILFAIM